MKYQGKVIRWNRDRGFGFIQWNGGKDQVFAHISSFSNRRRAPRIGDVVVYELGKDESGRSRAIRISYTDDKPKKRFNKPSPGRNFTFPAPLGFVAVIALAVFLYSTYARTPASTEPIIPSAVPPSHNFSCDGRTHCSQMTSCEEATYFIRHCPNTAMDGDGDGIPCERQWCSY